MPTYKGNVGNLMQHWTLCELLNIAGDHTTGLSFIDAHAMAPFAQESTETAQSKRGKFDSVKCRLPNRRESIYEWAWHRLAEQHEGKGYPNSAAFVEKVWYGDFSLFLCERDQPTVDAINDWLPNVRTQPRCKRAKVCAGDWRKRFRLGLPTPADVALSPKSLTLVSFDPSVISWHRRPSGRLNASQSRNVYPEDLQDVQNQLANFGGGVLIQLSTYGTNGNNTQSPVISSANSVLAVGGFTLVALVVVPDPRNSGFRQDMMSMVYARNVPWAARLANLPDRFTDWLQRV